MRLIAASLCLLVSAGVAEVWAPEDPPATAKTCVLLPDNEAKISRLLLRAEGLNKATERERWEDVAKEYWIFGHTDPDETRLWIRDLRFYGKEAKLLRWRLVRIRQCGPVAAVYEAHWDRVKPRSFRRKEPTTVEGSLWPTYWVWKDGDWYRIDFPGEALGKPRGEYRSVEFGRCFDRTWVTNPEEDFQDVWVAPGEPSEETAMLQAEECAEEHAPRGEAADEHEPEIGRVQMQRLRRTVSAYARAAVAGREDDLPDFWAPPDTWVLEQDWWKANDGQLTQVLRAAREKRVRSFKLEGSRVRGQQADVDVTFRITAPEGQRGETEIRTTSTWEFDWGECEWRRLLERQEQIQAAAPGSSSTTAAQQDTGGFASLVCGYGNAVAEGRGGDVLKFWPPEERGRPAFMDDVQDAVNAWAKGRDLGSAHVERLQVREGIGRAVVSFSLHGEPQQGKQEDDFEAMLRAFKNRCKKPTHEEPEKLRTVSFWVRQGETWVRAAGAPQGWDPDGAVRVRPALCPGGKVMIRIREPKP